MKGAVSISSLDNSYDAAANDADVLTHNRP